MKGADWLRLRCGTRIRLTGDDKEFTAGGRKPGAVALWRKICGYRTWPRAGGDHILSVDSGNVHREQIAAGTALILQMRMERAGRVHQVRIVEIAGRVDLGYGVVVEAAANLGSGHAGFLQLVCQPDFGARHREEIVRARDAEHCNHHKS